MAAFADPNQLVLGRPLTDQELLDASTLLDRASRMIRRSWPDIDTRITNAEIDPDDVADVVCQMVQRALLRPAGVVSVTEQRGPFATTERYSNADGGLYLTDAERDVFAAAGAASSRRAFSVDTIPASFPCY